MKTVLIVDDAAFIRHTLRLMLQKNGFEVVGEAENGEEGFAKYMELKPDIVTMDITMPETTGIKALKLILDADPQAKVVMVSGMGQQTFIKEAIVSGAKYFIVKPFTEEILVGTLNKILSR